MRLENWLEENFVSENTKATYQTAIKKFHQSQGYPRDSYELEAALKRWIRELNQNYKPKTVNTYVAAVVTFYRDKGIKVSEDVWRNLRRRLIPPAKESTFDKAGSTEEWKKILTHMDVKGRSLFLFLLSTGARIGETLQLKTSDLDLEADPPRAHIRPEYTKGGYGGRTVFMTYEAKDAIKEWLKVKEIPYLEDGEGMPRLRKKKTPKRIFNPKTGKYSYGKQEYDPEKIWDLNESTARQILIDALKKSMLDFKDPYTGRYQIHIHSTRKFFRSNCGLNDALVHALMGHEGYLDRSYLRSDPERAAEEYKSIAIPRLTIFERPTADKVELLKAFAKSLGINIKDIQIARIVEEEGIDEEEAIGRLIRQELTIKQTNTKIRKLITEEELPRYLEEGWEIEHVLNSKIVVAK